MTARLTLVALIVSTFAACGQGETTAVTVQLRIDSESCAVADAADIHISCRAVVGFTVLDATSGEQLDSACVDLPAPPSNLSSLPGALAAIDLKAISQSSVRLQIAVYAPLAASDGCPANGDRLDLVIAQSDQVVDLDNPSMPIEISCSNLETGNECTQNCGLQQNQCSLDVSNRPCLMQYDQCVQELCDENSCSQCTMMFQICLSGKNGDGGDDNQCAAPTIACLDECQEENCEHCVDGYQQCHAQLCELTYEQCLSGCTVGESCATTL